MADSPNHLHDHHFIIIGCGPVGLLFGGILQEVSGRLRLGNQVYYVDSIREVTEAIRSGVTIQGFEDPVERRNYLDLSFVPGAVFHDLRSLVREGLWTPANAARTVIVFATKTNVLMSLAHEVAQWYLPGTRILSLQNGIDNEVVLLDILQDSCRNRIQAEWVGRYVPNYAAEVVERKNQVKLSWILPSIVGMFGHNPDPFARQLAATLSAGRLATLPGNRKGVYEAQFIKTILNASLNPLSYLTGQTMKEAMTYRCTRRIVEALLCEGIEVFYACGIRASAFVVEPVETKQDLIESCIGYLSSAGDHHPSMFFDRLYRRPTEIHYLTHRIIQQATIRRIPIPYYHAVYSTVLEVERALLDRDRFPLERYRVLENGVEPLIARGEEPKGDKQYYVDQVCAVLNYKVSRLMPRRPDNLPAPVTTVCRPRGEGEDSGGGGCPA